MARSITTRALIAGLILATAGLAQADYLKLKNGTRIKGQATAYDTTTKTVSFRNEEGVVKTFGLDELDGRSLYLVTRSKVPKDSAEGLIQLANLARDSDLYAHAVRNYDRAIKADGSVQPRVDVEMDKLREQAAVWAMDIAKEAAAEGDIQKAEKWLTKIIHKLPNQPQAAEAQDILDRYYDQVRTERNAAEEKKHEERLRKDLKGAKRAYDSMIEKNKKALLGKGSSAAIREWKSAATAGDKAIRELDKFAKKHEEAGMSETLGGYRKVVVDQLIEVHLNLASRYSTQTSYKEAEKEVNKALALDSKNKAALSARVRIEESSSRGWGWGGRRIQ